jgi:hypothetical protein
MYGSPALKVGGSLLTCLAINKSAEPESLAVAVDFDQRSGLLAAIGARGQNNDLSSLDCSFPRIPPEKSASRGVASRPPGAPLWHINGTCSVTSFVRREIGLVAPESIDRSLRTSHLVLGG